MKKLIILFVFIALSLSLKSQNYKDYIIKISGDTIKCKINAYDDKFIFYNYLDLIKGKKVTYIKLKDIKKFTIFNESEILVQKVII